MIEHKSISFEKLTPTNMRVSFTLNGTLVQVWASTKDLGDNTSTCSIFCELYNKQNFELCDLCKKEREEVIQNIQLTLEL